MKPLVTTLITLSVAIASCTPKMYRGIPPVSSQIESSKTQVITDTVIRPVIDSAYMALFLECDSLGRVKIRGMENHVSSLLSANVTLSDNVMSLQSYIHSLERQRTIEIRDTVRERYEVSIPYPVPKIVNSIPWWAQLLSWLGGIYLLRIIIKTATNWQSLTIKKIVQILW